jgi:hypothetical protein
MDSQSELPLSKVLENIVKSFFNIFLVSAVIHIADNHMALFSRIDGSILNVS